MIRRLKRRFRLAPILPIFTLVLLYLRLERRNTSNWPTVNMAEYTLTPESLANSRFNLTHTPADQYTGPTVEGWPPGKDRTMSRYIGGKKEEDDHSKILSCADFSNARLLILVKSSAEYGLERQVNRETWVRFTRDYPQVLVLNVVGVTDNATVAKSVVEETDVFCDVLVVNVVDHYMNLTLKSVLALKFVYDNHRTVRPEFVLVTDDDSFVNVPLLWSVLFGDLDGEVKVIDGKGLGDAAAGLEIMGQIWPGPTLVRPAARVAAEEEVEKLNENKWICPLCELFQKEELHCCIEIIYMFDGNAYPKYVSGGSGYVIPAAAIPCLYLECMRMPFFHIEDVFVTGFAAERCGIKRKVLDGFHYERVDVKDLRATDVVIHYAAEEDLKEAYYEYFRGLNPNLFVKVFKVFQKILFS